MKADEIVFHPAFADELADAVEYLEREAELGEALLSEYEAALKRIVENPALYKLHPLGHRRADLGRFSYSIRFHWDGALVRVLAFPHHRRDGAYWLRRLAEFRGS